MIERELLEILACPRCKGRVVEAATMKWLRCEGCRMNYPVRDGFPVLLPGEAVPET